MSNSANVNSVDAIRLFAAAVMKFQEEARLCLSMMDAQLRQILFWLERDRPGFWKHEIENCMREVAEARVRLHQCRMRRMGDFRPSCIEEVKDLKNPSTTLSSLRSRFRMSNAGSAKQRMRPKNIGGEPRS